MCLMAGLGASVLSCTSNAMLNVWSANSSFAAGVGLPVPRTIQVTFINNTPYRAVFTYGAYDPNDQETVPANFGQVRVEGNNTSGPVNQPCRDAFAVGGAELVRLIKKHEGGPSITVSDPQALIVGVNFSSAPANDPLAAEPTEGTAEEQVLLSGVDYACARSDIRQTTGTGLLIVTFEQDAAAPGGFRIDYIFIPQ